MCILEGMPVWPMRSAKKPETCTFLPHTNATQSSGVSLEMSFCNGFYAERTIYPDWFLSQVSGLSELNFILYID